MKRSSLCNQTGAFDTLCEVLLQENVHNQNGGNGQQTASLQPDDLFPDADLDGGVIEQEQIQLGVQILAHPGNEIVVGLERTAH